MKYVYLLKALRKTRLPYDFRLYTYGPFDSDVLDDLRYAQALGAVKGTLVGYPGGRGYEYEPGPNVDEIVGDAEKFLKQNNDNIDWVLKLFGNRTAVDLEMTSTIIYIDRMASEVGSKQGVAELVKKVQAVKPYLNSEAIEREARALEEHKLLSAVS